MLDYNHMLDLLYQKLPSKKVSSERFEMPKLKIIVMGKNKVIINNFSKVASLLRRDVKDLAKYFSKALGTPVRIEKETLVIQRKVLPKIIQKKLEFYVNEYVLCKECHRPDTHIITQNGMKILVCEACGARRYLK